MKTLLIITITSLAVSFFFDRRKTVAGVKKAYVMIVNLLPSLLLVLTLLSIALYLISPERIQLLFSGESKNVGFFLAALTGSIALIPGFVAYPLCGAMVKNGVSLDIIAVFITTLMMVGILTLPIEFKFFGVRTALLRNGISLIGALCIGFLMSAVL